MQLDQSDTISGIFDLALADLDIGASALFLVEIHSVVVYAPGGIDSGRLQDLRAALLAASPAAGEGPVFTLLLPQHEEPRALDADPYVVPLGLEGAVAFISTRTPHQRLDETAHLLGRVCLRFFQMQARKEQELEQARELDDLKDRFLSALSHELRSPLTVLCGLLELLREGGGGPLNERQDKLVGQGLDQAGRIRWLVENLLDLSKIESGTVDLSREYTSVDALLSKALSPLRYEIERRGLHLEIDAQEEVPPVCVDANLVTQVLVNLVDNAAKYTPSSGVVRVAVRRQGAFVELSVSDTGRGIPTHEQHAVFDRYYRLGKRGAAGTGLGLSIAKEIVERHHGRIWIESEEERGSTFFFTLPVYDPQGSLQLFISDVRARAHGPLTFTLFAAGGRQTQAEDVMNTVMGGGDALFEYRDGSAQVLVLASFNGQEQARTAAERIEQRISDGTDCVRWTVVPVASDEDVCGVLDAVNGLVSARTHRAAS